jgi:hypothetical protein
MASISRSASTSPDRLELPAVVVMDVQAGHVVRTILAPVA